MLLQLHPLIVPSSFCFPTAGSGIGVFGKDNIGKIRGDDPGTKAREDKNREDNPGIGTDIKRRTKADDSVTKIDSDVKVDDSYRATNNPSTTTNDPDIVADNLGTATDNLGIVADNLGTKAVN